MDEKASDCRDDPYEEAVYTLGDLWPHGVVGLTESCSEERAVHEGDEDG